jgi:hypothetical protein
MKKIFYLFAITAFVFTSCNPLEDVNAEVDALKLAETVNDGLVEDLIITLTEDNYTALNLDNVYFNSEEEAKTLLPNFLTTTYPKLGVDFDVNSEILSASSAVVTYNLFNPISAITKKAYTLTDADYTDNGLTALNSNDDVNTFFSAKFSNEIKGTVYDLTFLKDPVLTTYTLTDEDYDLVGSGRFNNFDIRTGRPEETIEVRRTKIQAILLNNFPEAEFGIKYNVSYEGYDGSSNLDLELLVQLEENPTDASRTTDYTLVDEDYALVGNGNFNNFDTRDTSPDADVEARREKIQTILLNNYSGAVAGDFFVISYDTYDGAGRPVLKMILQFDGTDYNLFDVKIYALYEFTLESLTERFVLTDDWNAPITFTAEEYGIMGGSSRFSNFSGNADEAERKIKVYMKTLYPFAATDDFIAVEYKFFSGGVSAINMNLTYDGTNWTSLSASTEIILQLGHDGVTWVPDNTIKYSLTPDDYDLVDNGAFDNFDVRAGKGEFEESVRLEKINTILLTNFPQYGIDQKFSVSYNVWEPGDAVYIMNVINNGTEYILQ